MMGYSVKADLFLRKRYPNTPYTLMLLGTKFHIISAPTSVITVFRKTREFAYEPVPESLLLNAFGLPVTDYEQFHTTPSGRTHSAGVTPDKKELRIFSAENHSIYTKFLAGQYLDRMTQMFMKNFLGSLDEAVPSSDPRGIWKKVSFYAMLHSLMFAAYVID